MLSASSVLIITIALLVSLFVYFAIVTVKATVFQLEQKVDINIYFKDNAEEAKISDFRKLINLLPEVDKEKTVFISKKEALENFKERHKDNQTVMEALSIVNENPLGAILNIKAKEIGNYSEISAFVEKEDIQKRFGDIIEKVNYNENKKAIEKLNVLIEYTYKIGLALSAISIAVALIVTFNTMRLIIYTFRDEIVIMRLVGASRFFARGPFVVEGILYGIVSAFFALFISWTIVYYASPYLNQIFILNLNQYFSDNILYIFLALLAGGVILGFLSTYIAVSKYLKV